MCHCVRRLKQFCGRKRVTVTKCMMRSVALRTPWNYWRNVNAAAAAAAAEMSIWQHIERQQTLLSGRCSWFATLRRLDFQLLSNVYIVIRYMMARTARKNTAEMMHETPNNSIEFQEDTIYFLGEFQSARRSLSASTASRCWWACTLPLWFSSSFFFFLLLFSTPNLCGHWTVLNQTWTHIHLWLLFETFGPNSPGIYPLRAGGKKTLLGTDFDLWPNISLL